MGSKLNLKVIKKHSLFLSAFVLLAACNQPSTLNVKESPVNQVDPQIAINQAKQQAIAKREHDELVKAAILKNSEASSNEEGNPDAEAPLVYTQNQKNILAFFRRVKTQEAKAIAPAVAPPKNAKAKTKVEKGADKKTEVQTDDNSKEDVKTTIPQAVVNQNQPYLDLLAFQKANSVDCMYPRPGQIEWETPMDQNKKEYFGKFKVHITCIERFRADVNFDQVKRYAVSGKVDPNSGTITWDKENDAPKNYKLTADDATVVAPNDFAPITP